MIKNINICAFLEQFNREHEYLYDHHDHVAGYDEAVDSFDAFLKDKANASFVREFAAYRGDVVSRSREASAFIFTIDELTRKNKKQHK